MPSDDMSVFEFVSKMASTKLQFDSAEKRKEYIEDMTHQVSDYLNNEHDGSVQLKSSKPVEV